MRMAWIQNRDYPPIYDNSPWFLIHDPLSIKEINSSCTYYPSGKMLSLQEWISFEPKSVFTFLCSRGASLYSTFININTTFLFGIALFCGLIARLITGSWIFSCSISAMLLSRGRLISGLGQISDYYAISFLVTLWFFLTSFYLKTAAFSILILLISLSFLISLVFPEFFILFVGMSFFIFILSVVNAKKDYASNLNAYTSSRKIGILNKLGISFRDYFYLYRPKIKFTIFLVLSLGIILSGISLTSQKLGVFNFENEISLASLNSYPENFSEKIISMIKSSIDIDIYVSLFFIIITCFFTVNRTYLNLTEMVWILLWSLVAGFGLWSISWVIFELSGDAFHVSSQNYFNIFPRIDFFIPVFEPLILTFGALGIISYLKNIYYLLKRI